MSLSRLLITDLPSAAPRAGEVVVWVGRSDPPARVARHAQVVRAHTEQEAVAYALARSPARLRLQLRSPVPLLNRLTSPERRARAA